MRARVAARKTAKMKKHLKRQPVRNPLDHPAHGHAHGSSGGEDSAAEPSENSAPGTSTDNATGTNTANEVTKRPMISVPSGWTPEDDRKYFDDRWKAVAIGRHVIALNHVAYGLHRLGATLVIGRRILLCAEVAIHHDAVVFLPLRRKVNLLDSALNAYPPPDEKRFLEAAKQCRIAVAESERILVKFATNPEGTTLRALCDASEWLVAAAWSLEESFWMEFDGSQALFANMDESWAGEIPD